MAQADHGVAGQSRLDDGLQPQHLGDAPGVSPVILDRPDLKTSVGAGLQGIQGNDFMSGLTQVRIQGQPVVARGFQAEDDPLSLGVCLLDPVDKAAQTNVGIGDPERLASRFSFVIQENHLV